VIQLNGAGDKGHGTREGLSYRQIVRWANLQVRKAAGSEFLRVGLLPDRKMAKKMCPTAYRERKRGC
jgi:hypothetical protein